MLPTVIIILSVILAIYVLSKFNYKSKELFDGTNYKDFTNNNKNLDNILQSFSKLVYTRDGAIKHISNSYILTKDNLDKTLKQEVEYTIEKTLDEINSIYDTKYKLSDLERIKVDQNILKETQISVIFFIYEINKYSSRKVFMQYIKSNGETNLSHIRTVQSSNDDLHQPYISAEYHKVNTVDIVDEKLNLLHSQKKCSDDLNLYTSSEHKVVNLKLDNNCVISNLPKHIARPFVNPTIFALF